MIITNRVLLTKNCIQSICNPRIDVIGDEVFASSDLSKHKQLYDQFQDGMDIYYYVCTLIGSFNRS